MRPSRTEKSLEKRRARERYVEIFPPPGRNARAVFTGYPSAYSTGMSNLGFHFLYSTLARSGELRVERFFEDTAPLTLETGARLADAFALFLSVSYEEDYLNLIRILDRAGIEVLREKRKGFPLIIVGGPAVSANPFPLDEIVDAAVLGEGEGVLEEMGKAVASAKGREPKGVLERISGLDGMHIPGIAGASGAVRHGEMDGPFPHTVILTPDTVFEDTFLVEIGRGCPGSCGFCLATSVYNPYRPASIESLESVILGSSVPVGKVGLVSTAVTSHPRFFEIVDMLMRKGMRVAYSSLRAEDLTEKKAWIISRSGTKSASLAPESGSERLRAAVGKRVADGKYFDATELLARSGIRNISFYMLKGLPGEDEETMREEEIFLVGLRLAGGKARLSLHINTLIPKPWTPLQFFAMPGEKELSARIERLADAGRRLGFDVQEKSLRSSLRQAVISTGGREVGRAMIDHAVRGVPWKKALESNGADREIIHRERGMREPLPWDGIKGPVGREYLLKRYRAISGAA